MAEWNPPMCSACGLGRGTLAHALRCMTGQCSDPDATSTAE